MKQKISFLIISFFFVNLLSAQKNTQSFATISATNADSLITANYLNPNFIILDIRSISEYNSKHIENGVELNYYNSDFFASLDTLIKDKIYLLHCASGGRSGIAFDSMQTMGFTQVYNLSGGLNAWQNAGFPVVTSVAPIALSVSDTIAEFIDTEISTSDSLELKLTNYGNDTLKFLSITDLSGTEFTTNFNLNDSLTGLMDYSFKIFYCPIDLIDDSVIFTIETNGGNINYIIKANAVNTFVSSIDNDKIKIFPNPSNGIFSINLEDTKQIQVYNSVGKLVLSKLFTQQNNSINLSNYKKGIYFLKINGSKTNFVKKLILY